MAVAPQTQTDCMSGARAIASGVFTEMRQPANRDTAVARSTRSPSMLTVVVTPHPCPPKFRRDGLPDPPVVIAGASEDRVIFVPDRPDPRGSEILVEDRDEL
jgi:hypothetical protein